MIRIVCISDTHGHHHFTEVPAGDILLHAGDLTTHGNLHDVEAFDRWLGDLSHPHKVVIAGNHDFCFERDEQESRKRLRNATYLQDESTTILGLKIYGSPWQPWFYDWAFNLQRGPEIAAKWQLIPADTHLLITHGPPAGFGDRTFNGESAGCEDLLKRIRELKIPLHVCGHIHEGRGVVEDGGTLFVNASTNMGPGRGFVIEWDGQPRLVKPAD
jgi:Icc-related predicted phosphoesterase